MSDLFGNQIVGFPTRRLKWSSFKLHLNTDYSFKAETKQRMVACKHISALNVLFEKYRVSCNRIFYSTFGRLVTEHFKRFYFFHFCKTRSNCLVVCVTKDGIIIESWHFDWISDKSETQTGQCVHRRWIDFPHVKSEGWCN